MRPKTLILFFVAIGCGLVASIGVSQYMEKARGSAGLQLETQKIYVAASEINIGDTLDDKNIKLEEWPKDRIPEGAVTELKDLEGKFPRARLYKGEPILAPKLSTEIGANIAGTIPDGYRVVTVKVNSESGLAGLIRPGDRVDLVVFMRKSAEIPETSTKTILSDVNVFACDAETERAVDKGTGQAREVRTVSLLVKPNQVETVTLAKELGTMSLTLRRPGDLNETSTDGANVQMLLGSDGESANSQKNSGIESGLAKWLNQATAQPAPPPVEPTPAPAPVPAPVIEVEPELPPKFVMKIRTPNGDREYRWKELDGEPEEAGQDQGIGQTPATRPAQLLNSPAVETSPVQPGARAIPIRDTAPRTNAKARETERPAHSPESVEHDSVRSELTEQQDN